MGVARPTSTEDARGRPGRALSWCPPQPAFRGGAEVVAVPSCVRSSALPSGQRDVDRRWRALAGGLPPWPVLEVAAEPGKLARARLLEAVRREGGCGGAAGRRLEDVGEVRAPPRRRRAPSARTPTGSMRPAGRASRESQSAGVDRRGTSSTPGGDAVGDCARSYCSSMYRSHDMRSDGSPRTLVSVSIRGRSVPLARTARARAAKPTGSGDGRPGAVLVVPPLRVAVVVEPDHVDAHRVQFQQRSPPAATIAPRKGRDGSRFVPRARSSRA